MMADIKPGQTVWLVPKTPTAPPVAYGRPSGVVVAVDGVYLVVNVPQVGGVRVHIDNIVRRDPNARADRGVQNGGRKALPDGFTEVTLW